MTRRGLLIPALLALATTLCATASTAAIDPQRVTSRYSSNDGTWTTERYYTQETWHAFADVGKKDNGGPGDIYAAKQTLRSTGGETVGVVNGYGVNLHPPYVFFHWTATLRGGTLTLEGAVDLRKTTSTYPIEGGTGRYAAARGTVTLTDVVRKGTLVTVLYQR